MSTTSIDMVALHKKWAADKGEDITDEVAKQRSKVGSGGAPRRR